MARGVTFETRQYFVTTTAFVTLIHEPLVPGSKIAPWRVNVPRGTRAAGSVITRTGAGPRSIRGVPSEAIAFARGTLFTRAVARDVSGSVSGVGKDIRPIPRGSARASSFPGSPRTAQRTKGDRDVAAGGRSTKTVSGIPSLTRRRRSVSPAESFT